MRIRKMADVKLSERKAVIFVALVCWYIKLAAGRKVASRVLMAFLGRKQNKHLAKINWSNQDSS
jgi:hypothetical protein